MTTRPYPGQNTLSDAQHLRLALKSGQLGSWELDLESGDFTASPVCRASFGFAPGERLRYSDLLLKIHAADRPGFDWSLRRAARTGEEFNAEFRVLSPDSSVRWVGASGCHSASSETVMVGVTLDVTERLLTQVAQNTSEKHFRTLADSIPQLAWMAEPDGSVFWYNQRWYEYTGTTPEEMEGWGWRKVQDPDYLPLVMERWQASLNSGEPFEMTFPLRAADGTFRTFLTKVSPMKGPDGAVFRWFGTNTDVDIQTKAEEALRQSEKLAVVGRLAASIAHEINNPLEAVTNLIYLAKTSENPLELRAHLEVAEHELGRISQITTQTLRFHKQQTSPTATSVPDLLRSILALYQGKLNYARVETRLELRDGQPLVCYDGELRQVLANMIGNALDAMPGGGRLRIRVRPATDWRTGDPAVRITIADSGHGMSYETRKRIYQPFFTTKGVTGTGLGLWVSAGIVEKHSGSMHVRSRETRGSSGTAFTLILPHRGVCRTDKVPPLSAASSPLAEVEHVS